MKAIAKTVPGKGVELIDIPAPRVRPGDLLVEVKACGICGSDLHFSISGNWRRRRFSRRSRACSGMNPPVSWSRLARVCRGPGQSVYSLPWPCARQALD